jgi:hypothetical protein
MTELPPNLYPLPAGPRRVPPHSQEAEESVIGGILVYSKTFETVTARVRSEDFYHPALRSVFDAMVALHRDSKPIDAVSVYEQMRAFGTHDKLRAFGGAEWFTALMAGVVTVENLGYHADIIASRASLRRLQASLTETVALTWRTDVDPSALAASAAQAVEQYTSRRAVVEGLPVKLAHEIAEPDNTRWLIEDVWIAGGVGFVAGEPKTKKSFLTLEMAISVASGQKMLNRFRVPQQGAVVLFNGEDRPSETRRRIEGMCNARGIRLDSIAIYVIDVPGLRLTDAAQMRALDATIERIRPKLAVFDPFRNLYDGDEDNSQHVMGALDPLRLLQRRHDTAVAVVHHNTKPNELKRRAGQQMRGSGALHGWGDSNLYVSLKQGVSCVEVEQRYAEPIEPFGWTLKDMETADGKALWCDPCAIPSTSKQTEETKSAGANSDEMILLNTIRAAGGPISANAIEEVLPMNRKALLAAIKSLSSTGAIEQVSYERIDSKGRKQTASGWVERGAHK